MYVADNLFNVQQYLSTFFFSITAALAAYEYYYGVTVINIPAGYTINMDLDSCIYSSGSQFTYDGRTCITTSGDYSLKPGSTTYQKICMLQLAIMENRNTSWKLYT